MKQYFEIYVYSKIVDGHQDNGARVYAASSELFEKIIDIIREKFGKGYDYKYQMFPELVDFCLNHPNITVINVQDMVDARTNVYIHCYYEEKENKTEEI